MAGAEVDDATAAKSRRTRRAISQVSYSSFRGRHRGMADCPADAVKQRVVGKPTDVTPREAVARRGREHPLLPAARIAREPRRQLRLGFDGRFVLSRCGVDLAFEVVVVGETRDLVHEHQRVL